MKNADPVSITTTSVTMTDGHGFVRTQQVYKDDPSLRYRVAYVAPDNIYPLGEPLTYRAAMKLARYLALILPDAQFSIESPCGQSGHTLFNYASREDHVRYQIGSPEIAVVSSTTDKYEARFRARCLAALTGTTCWRIRDAVSQEDVSLDFSMPPKTHRAPKPRRAEEE